MSKPTSSRPTPYWSCVNQLDVLDMESAILTGIIERVFDDDDRGRRYEVVGKACDLMTDIASCSVSSNTGWLSRLMRLSDVDV